MQRYDSNSFLCLPSCLNATSYMWTSATEHCRWHRCYSNKGASEKSQGSCLLLLS